MALHSTETGAPSLHSRLRYTPQPLRFGTSGRRGELIHLTQLEIYINALAEIRYLQQLPFEEGGVRPGEPFFFGYDLRPSSTSFDPAQQGRGEIAQAIERAIHNAGMLPVNLGALPTPALTYYALTQRKGSIMITGSHIPFDRNGYKLNTSRGELLKEHETPINNAVAHVRHAEYEKPYSDSLFNEDGMFKERHIELSRPLPDGELAYINRYREFFAGRSLRGKRIAVYQHSAVGRDLLCDLLRGFDAEVIPVGRSETFVPIDTENIDAAQLATIEDLTPHAPAQYGSVDAVVSTDGDSDRPLLLGPESDSGKLRFFSGDLVGMIVADFLGADAVVVPISCNDAIDRGSLAAILRPKTRIGSPFVIAGMQEARQEGKHVVCGWEANGGFLTGSDIEKNGRILKALPTRDAILPILATLFKAQQEKATLCEIFSRLPRRFSRAALIRNFPREIGLRIVQRFSPRPSGASNTNEIASALKTFFTPEQGFADIASLNYTDGVRILFSNGEVAHVRPSGNADELRIYAVADSPERADAITAVAVKEPDGILRRMQRAVSE